MKTKLKDMFEQHARELRSFLRRRGHTVEAADDLTHDAFVRVMMAKDDDKIENPRAYLRRVACNLSTDMKRRERRERRMALSDQELSAIADLSPSQETVVSDRQKLALVEEALSQLPERVRYAFEAHRMGEKTIAQIADELGLSTTRTWNLIREGYGALRARLREEE